jgi:DNA repair protein RadC
MDQYTLDLELEPNHDRKPLTIACGERPQERLETFGVAALSDTELVATILQGGGTRAEEALAIASRLVAEAGSLAGLTAWQHLDYRRVRGIGRSKGLQLAAIAEIARRMMKTPGAPDVVCNRTDAIAAMFWPMAAGLPIEKFWVMCLNRKNRLIKLVEISSGTATATLVHPREVFREAVRHSATGIVCAHNHPSGDPAPSQADLSVTRQLREAARAIDIELIDHLIIGRPQSDPAGLGYYSFRQSGLI